MAHDDEPTCGKGLAEHSVIPGKLGELIDGLAANLECHMPSLPETDAMARHEKAAYARIAAQHREIAKRLRAVAEDMAGCRAMPMGAHDEQALMDPRAVTAFEQYIATLRQVVATLQASLAADEQLLG